MVDARNAHAGNGLIPDEGPITPAVAQRLLEVGLEPAEGPNEAPPTASAGDVFAGKLELKELLGQGGMGEVWRAYHRDLERDVAVKLMDPTLARDREFAERFRREALAAQSIVHENVVQVRDFGATDAGRLYMTMDLVRGESLAGLMAASRREERPIPAPRAVEIICQVLAGLQRAHDMGIIHRDVKPSNVLLSPSPAGLRAQLTDFGVAAAVPGAGLGTHPDTPLTRAGSAVGTLLYMSPEQATGGTVTPASDVYSAAAILYEMLAGRRPTVGENERAFRHNLLSKKPRPIRSVAPDRGVSSALDRAVLKALDADPARRYPSAGDFAAVLKEAAKAEVKPPSKVAALTLHCREAIRTRPRLRRLLAAAVILAAAGVGLAIGLREELGLVSDAGPTPVRPVVATGPAEPAEPAPPRLSDEQVQAARDAGVAPAAAVLLAPGVTMTMVYIPPGQFLMGSPEAEARREPNEGPRRWVAISRGFYIASTEVTQAQWQAVMKTTPWQGKRRAGENPKYAANYLTWEECQRFVDRVNQGLKTLRLALPTEAQWEYACRAGSTTQFSYGEDVGLKGLGRYAWYVKNQQRLGQVHPRAVGLLTANRWGLFDMHGGVAEWCADWMGPFDAKATLNPTGPKTGTERALRGGAWYEEGEHLRAARRDAAAPDARFARAGLRCVALVPGAAGEEYKPVDVPDWAALSRAQLIAAAKAGVPPAAELDLGGDVASRMVFIPPGDFIMGSLRTERGRRSYEGLQRRVTISRGFYVGLTEVTQAEFQAVMGKNPSYFKGPTRPVEHVEWADAMEFCRRLTDREREAGHLKPGEVFRLPTEAEWEYACRAGTTTPYFFGNRPMSPYSYAWFTNNTGQTHPVGGKRANPWGLYDMHGNAAEWCMDWFGPYPFPPDPQTDPQGPTSSTEGRVLRGGSWASGALHMRSAWRDVCAPAGHQPRHDVGFRYFRTVVPPGDD